MMSELLKKWVDVVLHPKKLFARENKAKNLSYGAISILVSGIISAIIVILASLVSPTSLSGLEGLFGPAAGAIIYVFILIFVPVMSLVMWIVISGVLYLFSMVFHGKGDFTSQSHALALVNSAFGVLSTIVSSALGLALLSLPSINVLQVFFSTIITVYNLYVITIALKSVHRYSTAHAVLAWLIPLIIAVVLLLLLAVTVLTALVGTGAINTVNV